MVEFVAEECTLLETLARYIADPTVSAIKTERVFIKATCSKCGKEKPNTEFYTELNVKNKTKSLCILCHKAYAKDHYQKTRGK